MREQVSVFNQQLINKEVQTYHTSHVKTQGPREFPEVEAYPCPKELALGTMPSHTFSTKTHVASNEQVRSLPRSRQKGNTWLNLLHIQRLFITLIAA